MDKVEQLAAECQHDEFVTIEAGDGEQHFVISKNLLCDVSKYFVAALKGEWKEASEGRLCLPGANADTTKLFIYWLQKGRIPSFGHEVDLIAVSEEHEAVHVDRIILLARLWTLGDQILSPKLQNAAIGGLLEIASSRTTPFDAIHQGCQIAHKDSKLSKFFMAELRYALFNAETVTGSEFEQLAAIPGVIADFMGNVAYAMSGKEKVWKQDVFCYATEEGDQESYLVEE